MAKQQLSQAKKGAKKIFYEVSAPITATKIQLYASSAEELEGRVIKLDLTKSLKGKSLELRLRIKKDGDKLSAEPEYIELAGSYVRRGLRRGTDYVEDSFEAECRDFIIKIKPFMITRRRVSRAVLKALRETARKNLEAYVKTRTAQEIFSDIITNKIQKQLSAKLKTVYPLALCEIRMFHLVKEKPKEQKAPLEPKVA
ncbi:MAG: hypothetical protein Q7S74_00550 [Nanoarchaeota archaeon]|nr:hypothetical protein [Nanoarchaeota archaeon]